MTSKVVYQIGWGTLSVHCPKCSATGLERSLHRENNPFSLYIRCQSCGYTDGWTPENPIYYSLDHNSKGEEYLIIFLAKTPDVPIFAKEPTP